MITLYRTDGSVLATVEGATTITKAVRTLYAAGRRDFRRANLAGADLRGACLVDANLADANLVDAILSRAYLRAARLVGADLRRADLCVAYLADANLVDAILSSAMLNRANLRRANLRRANMGGAYLTDAILTGAILPDGTTTETYDPRPLFAEGKAVPAEAWRCHSWNNCPLHHAYGASAVHGLPRRLRSMAGLWLALYDGHHPCALRGLVG